MNRKRDKRMQYLQYIPNYDHRTVCSKCGHDLKKRFRWFGKLVCKQSVCENKGK